MKNWQHTKKRALSLSLSPAELNDIINHRLRCRADHFAVETLCNSLRVANLLIETFCALSSKNEHRIWTSNVRNCNRKRRTNIPSLVWSAFEQ